MSERILFVDDEPRVLQGVQRQLQRDFDLVTAEGGQVGLEAIASEGPFAVVVSDMRMPQMNGIQFLTHVSEISPDTVRVMLTGQADFNTAVEAINHGRIYRFLNKPCPSDLLATTLKQALEQYRLVIAERVLLSQTLTGSVKALIDILSLNNPIAFGRAARIRRIVADLARRLGVADTWELEIASLLSHIGLVAVPETIWAKVRRSEWLSPEETAILQGHPQVARDLLKNIPRLAGVSEIVNYQNKHFDGSGYPTDAVRGEQIPLGARLLRIATDFEAMVAASNRPELALAEICDRAGHYDPQIVTALKGHVGIKSDTVVRGMKLNEIPDNAIFAVDVTTLDNEVLIGAGGEMSPAVRMRLQNYVQTGTLRDSFQIQVAAGKQPIPVEATTATPVDFCA
ncbi:MAG: response regulator [Planctomycetaceae bacterium]|nr:response regulator [Planctomycetales bacterium]MCB9923281.1 response regulator [Planctomycetaceae bacterium]